VNNTQTNIIHWSFWLVAAFGLLWNLGGSANFFMQMDAGIVASFPESDRAIIEGRPLWATAGFGLSVFAGALGALLLFLKKALAIRVFAVSLFGTAVTMVHTVMVASGTASFSVGEIFAMILLPLAVAGVLMEYSRRVSQKGWIQ